MNFPNIKDLIMYVNKALSGQEWNSNWQKIINWLTDGKTDIKVKSIELSSSGGIVNNGSLTQSGNLSVDGNLEVSGTIAGDGSNLYNLKTQGVQAFTPFCVNNGYKDLSTGNGDLIVATPVTESTNIVRFDITFKVDSGTTYGKLKATTAAGNTFELDQLVYNSALAANGSFNFFIGSGQQVAVAYKNTIYRQPFAPTSTLNTNDVWLDTSGENLVSYKYTEEGTWEKWDFLPIGKVVVANIGTASATATVTTFIFNWNGYNVNMGGCIDIAITEQPRVVIKTYSSGANWYRIYSDGWVEQGGATTATSQGTTQSVTYNIPMKDTNYCLTLSAGIGAGSGSTNTVIESTSTTGCVIWTGSPSYYKWYVCGYKA